MIEKLKRGGHRHQDSIRRTLLTSHSWRKKQGISLTEIVRGLNHAGIHVNEHHFRECGFSEQTIKRIL